MRAAASTNRDRQLSAVLLLLTAICVTVATTVWLRRDAYVDREESGHVQRAFQTLERIRDADTALDVPRRLFHLRMTEDAKPWYGFPYYAAVAAIWSVTGPSYDSAAALNLLWLAIAIAAIHASVLAISPRDYTAAAFASTLFAVLPGTLLWTHLFSPTLFLVATTSLACALLLHSDLFSRPAPALGVGLVLAVACVTKLTAFIYWAPLLPYCLAAATRPLVTKRRMLGVALAALGLSPALLYVFLNRVALSFWNEQLRALWAAPSMQQAFGDIALRWLEVAGPVLLWVLVVGALAGLRSPHFLRSSLLVIWATAPSILVPLTSSQSGSSRDHLPAFAALTIVAATGLFSLIRDRVWIVQAVVAAFGLLIGCVVMFDVFPGLLPGHFRAAIRRMPSGVFRLEPWPDVVGRVLARMPPVTGGRCSCVGATPYPVRNQPDLPVLSVDALALGPENIEVWHRFRGRQVPWHLGITPYPLPCSAYRLAMACTSIVITSDGPGAGYPRTEVLAAERRRELERWGTLAEVVPIPGIAVYSIRMNTVATPCSLAPASSRLAWHAHEFSTCDDGQYYTQYLRLLFGPAHLTTHESINDARALANGRLKILSGGGDAPSVVFGEEFLVRSTLDQLYFRESFLDARP